MKTEFLKSLELTEEQIASIMKENGKDVETAKSKFSDYDEIKKQLGEATAAITGFKDLDVDGIKKAADDWKLKAENAEKDKNTFIHKSKVEGYVKSLGLKDDVYENHIANMLLQKELKFDGDTLVGADDVIKPFKETHADAFSDGKTVVKVISHTGGAQTSPLQKADYQKLSYLERVKLKQTDPDTYKNVNE